LDLYKKKLLRRLKSKCHSLGKELEHVELIYNDALPLFIKEVNLYCASNKIENPLNNLDSDQDKKNKKESLSDDFKFVYRQIAKKTHPDVNTEDEFSLKLYRSAVKAKNDNDINEIISIAKDLNIDINTFKYSDITKIERSIENTEAKIKKITTSYPYVWFFSNSKKRPDIIAGFTFKMCNS
jgi:hypothetical protein